MSERDFFLGGEVGCVPADAAVALIVVDNERYLMQLRDQKPGIFYPGHWGVFGGALDPGENVETALKRELFEELGYRIDGAPRYFTAVSFDFAFCGRGKIVRSYYEVHVRSAEVERMVLTEGEGLRAFGAREILDQPRVVPYDAFAIWMHATKNLLWPS